MPESRIEQWKRKLLDLSLRNSLLNVRDGNCFLPIDEGAPYTSEAAKKRVDAYAAWKPASPLPFKTAIPENESDKRLKEIYRSSRLLRNESGVNSLFLAVGFLSWRERTDEPFHQAPLILIPAELVRQTVAPGYKLMRTEEDAVVNFCLLELMCGQFGLPIADVAGGGVGDGDPDFTKVFAAFSEAIKGCKDWTITTRVTMGIFSFSKVVIWKDLVEHGEAFKKHPFVAHLAEGTGLFDDGVEVFPPEEVSKHANLEELYCPLATDSSQLAAVLYSGIGKSFVLHGPPGTGKSQTIANIIAHNLAKGKRVLFVSEKRAALDVVYKRLATVGLAPFCLELHSSKAYKVNVMRQFKEALDVTPSCSPAKWSAICADISASAKTLNAYVRDLHAPCASGMSAYDYMERHGESHLQADPTFVPDWVVDAQYETRKVLSEIIHELVEEWNSIDKSDHEALKIVRTKDWSPEWAKLIDLHAADFIETLARPKSIRRTLQLFWLKLHAFFQKTIYYPSCLKTDEEKRGRIQTVRDHLGGLRLEISYRAVRRKADDAGCRKFVGALEEGKIPSGEAFRVFQDSCSERMMNVLVSRSKVLSGFSGKKHETRIAHFREMDEAVSSFVRQRIVALLSRLRYEIEHPPVVKDNNGNVRIPVMDAETARQMAVLKKECEKKKRFMPPRKLLAETMKLALRLKPCFLMSPLSVAQYLPVKDSLFDMVVFDEASQMTVWDSVGVIARGKQLIVVGDPKQLPPTNFFVKGDAKEKDLGDDSAAEDMESILDECLANGLYSAYLNWHYRSRHESLIAFSNRHYYNERLNTFPAALSNNDRLGMTFRYVDGALYDHNSHTNRKEAESIVNFLFERLSEPAERARSWGIVTFSVAQQRLIEDLIDDKIPEVDWAADFFEERKPDAFFVRNLENVQGDERDVIMFSIAYAPDDMGRFAMSFGPVNRPGGERRLNVAITRAREQVIIFASVRAADIRAERTSSLGVRHLKSLMEYAESGHLEGASQSHESVRLTGMRRLICECLEKNGYAFKTEVGLSSFPIDIAVRSPADPESFILAIECDGRRYAAQRTVRDRDVLRDAMLAFLGWKVYHAWSVDWAFDREHAEVRLLEALKSQQLCGQSERRPPIAAR